MAFWDSFVFFRDMHAVEVELNPNPAYKLSHLSVARVGAEDMTQNQMPFIGYLDDLFVLEMSERVEQQVPLHPSEVDKCLC